MNSSKILAYVLRFLQWFCPDHLYEEIEGDLMQRFNKDVKTRGEKQAKRRFVWNAIRFFRPGILLRNKFSVALNRVPMISNYLKTTYRHIGKNKLNFSFKVVGLSVAIFSFLVVAIYVSYQISFDRYNINYENIYRVNSERKEDGKQEKYGIVPAAIGPLMSGKFPEIESLTRIQIGNGNLIHYKSKVISGGIFPADSTLFDVFTFDFVEGNEDALRNPNGIVLTKMLSDKLFEGEHALGKIVSLSTDKKLYEVTAVINDMRPDSHFRVDGFILFKEEFQLSSANITSPVDFVDKASILYVKLKSDNLPKVFSKKLESLVSKYVGKKVMEENGFHIYMQPLADIYLSTPLKYEFTKKGSSLYVYLFLVMGVLLLVTATINYVNLSIVDFSTRSREMSVRKVFGSLKSQISFQVILETIFYIFLSLIVSIVSLYLFFPKVVGLLEPNLHFEMLFNQKVVYAVLCIVLLLVVLSAGLPAYWLSTGNLAMTIKSSAGPQGYWSFSQVLLVFQFVISIVCISASLTVGDQLDYIHTKDLGIDRKNLVVLTMPDDFSVNQMKVFKNKLKTLSGISNVSNSSFRMGGGYWKDWYTVEVDGKMKSFELYEVFSDDDLFSTLDMTLLEGRLFNDDLPADSGSAFVINETAAKYFGWDQAVGKKILTHPEESGRWDGTIVGVVKDINISTLHQKVQPLVMRLPWQNNYPEYFIYLRINGESKATVRSIELAFNEMLPGYPIDLAFVDDYYNSQYGKEDKVYSSLQFGTIMVVLVSALGIFSLSIYLSGKRRKEFGIRKVLGATVKQISFLHLGHFLKLALIACIIALPLGYWFMKEWLEGFAYRTETGLTLFVSVVVIFISMIITSSGYSAWKAGRMNPVDAIKTQ